MRFFHRRRISLERFAGSHKEGTYRPVRTAIFKHFDLSTDTKPTQQVIFVNGDFSSCRLEFSKVVFAKNAIVWITARSKANGEKTIQKIKASDPTSSGQISYVLLGLADLPPIKPAVEKLKARSSGLDLLMNAGVMFSTKKIEDQTGIRVTTWYQCHRAQLRDGHPHAFDIGDSKDNLSGQCTCHVNQ
jgi:hypothetical protein